MRKVEKRKGKRVIHILLLTIIINKAAKLLWTNQMRKTETKKIAYSRAIIDNDFRQYIDNTCLKISNRKLTLDHKENSHKLWAKCLNLFLHYNFTIFSIPRNPRFGEKI